MTQTSKRSFLAHPMGKWGLFMLFLFALWFAGWYAFANFAHDKIGEALEDAGQQGINVDCANLQMRGFPFRIGVYCDSLNIAGKGDALQLEIGAVRTAAQLYAPGELVAELDGPFKTGLNNGELAANWSAMRLFLDVNFSGGFDLASLTFSNLSTSLNKADLKVADGAVHFRPTPQTDGAEDAEPVSLDGALKLTNLSAALPKLTIPDATIEIDGTLVDGYRDLVVGGREFSSVMQDGAEFEIRNLALSLPDGGRLAFSGPLSIGEDGLLSGEINVGVANPPSVARWAGEINPQLAQQIGLITQAVAGMGKPAKIGGADINSITLKIEQGIVRLGFIQFPDPIPPMFRD